MIHVSTLSVYATAGLDLVDEDGPLQTEGVPYGRTKAEGDRIVLDAVGRGLPATIVRPGAILGVHPTSTWAVRIPKLIRERTVKLKRDGGDTLPFVHVEDVVGLALRAADKLESIGRVYNVADHPRTWRAFTDEVRNWFGTAPLDVIPESDPASKTYWTGRFDTSRARSELGYEPRHSYAEGMSEAKRYWGENRA
jgi:nucleoside-diphosphate-sugar epimerase